MESNNLSFEETVLTQIAELEKSMLAQYARNKDIPGYLSRQWADLRSLVSVGSTGGGDTGGGGIPNDLLQKLNNLDNLIKLDTLDSINQQLAELISLANPDKSTYKDVHTLSAITLKQGTSIVYYSHAHNLSHDDVYIQVYDLPSLPNNTAKSVHSYHVPPGVVVFFDDDLPLKNGLTVAWSLEEETYSYIAPGNKRVQLIYG